MKATSNASLEITPDKAYVWGPKLWNTMKCSHSVSPASSFAVYHITLAVNYQRPDYGWIVFPSEIPNLFEIACLNSVIPGIYA